MALSGIGLVHEYRTAGSNNNGGGFVWIPIVNSTLQWNASGSGTDEYYLQASGGGNPGVTACNEMYLDGKHNLAAQGSVGSLAAGEWDFADNDALGYSVPYVRLSDGLDPDSKGLDFVGYGKAGGVDYSQQATAEKSAADFASNGAGTTITSASAGVPSDVAGNLFYVSNGGVGGNIDWYEILTYISPTQFTIDRSCGAGATGMTGAIGGARALPTDAGHEANVAGNTTYMKNDGTYTLTAAIVVGKDGTAKNYIRIIGYKTDRGDCPVGDDRPYIAAAANEYAFDDYWDLRHIRMTTTNGAGIRPNGESRLTNMKCFNSSGVGGRPAFSNADGLHTYVDCEGISTNGRAFGEGGSHQYHGCYAHDSVDGFELSNGAENVFINCIADTCTKGFNAGFSADDHMLINCVVYNCTDGLYTNSDLSNKWTVMNTIFKDNTTAINWSDGRTGSMYLDYNTFHGNTTDVINVAKGPNTKILDPEFVDAPNGDFSVGKNMEAIGWPGLFAGGLSTGFMDIGAIQRQGGAGESTTGHVS